ncbi:MAG: translation initiation factor IF-2 [Microgenomates group bacterium]
MAISTNLKKDIEEKLQKRPPIVVVLGHVDHGKTTLISQIYQEDLTRKEYGGISQHIGAYQVSFQTSEGKVEKITFIDTPGHVAFSKMRSRGATVADLAVLVVAADEGVKPQTLESLKHIQEAKIPFIVAINKIDLPNIDLNWLKGNLAENNILVEEWGGKIPAVSVSAKTGQGIKDLLEMIILLSEINEIKGNPQKELEAVIIESKLDPRRGPLATVLIRDGSLKKGEEIFAEEVKGKIKLMVDDKGKPIDFAGPSQPVEILGFEEVPPVGARVTKTRKEEFSKEKKEFASFLANEKEEKKIKIILKTDTQGTLEAILNSLPQEVEVVASGTGEIGESDVLLAKTTGAEIIAFNIKISGKIKKLAEFEKVKISSYQIIYEFLEELEKKVLKILEPTIDEEILGEAEILAEFLVKNQRVAGGRVKEGEIHKQFPIHLKRRGEIIGDGKIVSLKKGKEDVNKVIKGEEFGAIFEGIDFKIGDVIISFKKLPQ